MSIFEKEATAIPGQDPGDTSTSGLGGLAAKAVKKAIDDGVLNTNTVDRPLSDLRSLIVTDPDLLDPELDVSGLRTQTDTDPRLLASIADFPGISYDPTRFDYLSDLNKLFAYGLPVLDTQTTTPSTGTGGGGSGDGGQATVPGAIDTFVTPPDTNVGVNTPEEQRLIDAGIGVQIGPGDPVVAPGEIPVTQDELDAFNQTSVTPVSPPGQPIDPTGMLPQTSTPFMVPGALGVDPLEKQDFITEKDAADPTFLSRIGLGQFDPAEALVKAAINAAVGKPVTLLIDILKDLLPPQDPRVGALNELYPDRTSAGTIASGLMTGYNPVSGGFLNTITGGRYGDETTYGLQEAYDERIESTRNSLQKRYGLTEEELDSIQAGNITDAIKAKTISETMSKTYGKPTVSNLVQNLADFETMKTKEKKRLDLFSGDIDERDQMLEDIVAQNKAQAEADAIRLRNLTGDVDFDTQPTGVNPFADIDTGVGEFDTGTNIVDEVALTGAPTALELAAGQPIFDETIGKFVDAAGNPIQTTGDVQLASSVEENVLKGYQRELDSLKGQKEQVGELGLPTDQIDDAIKNLEETIKKLEEEIKSVTIEQTGLGEADDFDTTPTTTTGDNPFADIDTGVGDFDTTPVDEFNDEAFMVGDTSTAAPTTGDSGADSFFDAVDTITGGGGGRDRDPDPSPSFDPGQGFVDQGGGGEFGSAPSKPTTGTTKPGTGGGNDGGGDKGGGGCVIATHAVNSGAFTKDTKREAVRWCVKNLHRTWWGEAIRRGYRYYGQKAIDEGKAKNHYQEFKDYVAFGTGKKRTLKTGWTFVYRSIQFFVRGLING